MFSGGKNSSEEKNWFIGPNEAEKFLKKTAETELMEEFSRFYSRKCVIIKRLLVKSTFPKPNRL